MTASLWKEGSLIRKINNNEDSIVNALFADLLTKSNEIQQYTEGAFDCTVGQLVNRWGFGAEARQKIIDSDIDSLRQFTGIPLTVTLDSLGRYVVHKPRPETQIDFNAIAQGYSVDIVCQHLKRHGIHNFLIDIGGEVYASGHKANNVPWIVGIERPASNKYSEREVETAVAISNKALVTSGNYRKYYERNGEKYSHTIDPATGYPVTHTLLSVTVVDTATWRADALATAFMVMGKEKALEFAQTHKEDNGTKALFFIYNDNGKYKTFATPAFEQMISDGIKK